MKTVQFYNENGQPIQVAPETVDHVRAVPDLGEHFAELRIGPLSIVVAGEPDQVAELLGVLLKMPEDSAPPDAGAPLPADAPPDLGDVLPDPDPSDLVEPEGSGPAPGAPELHGMAGQVEDPAPVEDPPAMSSHPAPPPPRRPRHRR